MHPLSRTLSFLLLALLLLPVAHAETVWFLEDGSPIRAGQGFTSDPLSAASDDGQTLVLWRDGRSGDLEIYGQLSDGNQFLWPANGILLAAAPGLQELGNVVAVDDGFIFTWLDARNSADKATAGDLYAQKVDFNGELQWQEDDQPLVAGIQVAAMVDERAILDPFQVAAEDGGSFICYGRTIPGSTYEIGELVIKKLTSTGEPAVGWPVDGILLDSVPVNDRIELDEAMASEGQGGVLIAWKRGVYPEYQILATRVLSDGSRPWNDGDPVLLGDDYLNTDPPQVVMDGSGGAFVSWMVPSQGGSLRLQRINNSGTPQWQDGGEIIATNPDPQFMLRRHAPGSVVVVWTEDDAAFVQRYNGTINAVPMWGAEPVELIDESANIYNMLVDYDGNTIVVFRISQEDDLRLQHFDLNGTRQHYGNGLALLSFQGLVSNAPRMARTTHGVSLTYPGVINGGKHLFLQHYMAASQTSNDPQALTTGIDGEVREYASIANNNAVYTVWLDSRQVADAHVGPGFYLQALDRDSGQPLLESNGQPLMPGGGDYTGNSESIQLIHSGDGNFFASFLYAGELSGLFVQKFTPTGSLLWGNTGKLYNPDQSPYYTLSDYRLVATDDGGVIVLFTTWINNTVMAQRFNEFGHPVWTDQVENYIELNPSGLLVVLHDHEVLPNGDILYLTSTVDNAEAGLWLNRLTQDGEQPWGDPVQVSSEDCNLADISPVADGVLVSWRVSQYVYMMQRYDQDGTPLWPEPINIYAINDEDPRLIVTRPDETEAFWVIVKMGDLLGVQRHSLTDGQPMFGGGFVFLNSGWDVDHLDLEDDGVLALDDGGLIVAWDRELGDNNVSKAVYLRINADGSFPAGYAEPQPLAGTLGHQNNVTLVPDGFGGVYAQWFDRRAVAGLTYTSFYDQLYAHRIHDDITDVTEDPGTVTPSRWQLGVPYPNPFNAATSVTLTLPSAQPLRVAVYDVLGREIAVLHDGNATAGSHRLAVNATEWASGIYFLRAAVGDDAPRTRKLVLLK